MRIFNLRMAVAAYISPFRIFGLTPDVDVQELQRARHRLFTEFELTGQPEIVVGGTRLGKSDIERLAEEVFHPQLGFLHRAVMSNPALCAFLETGALTVGYSLLPNQHAAIDLLRPYLLAQFDAQLALAFTQRMSAWIRALTTAVSAFGYDFRDYYFRETEHQLRREIESMKSFADGQRRHLPVPVKAFLHAGLKDALLALPSPLSAARENYGMTLAEFYVAAAGREISYDIAESQITQCCLYFPERWDMLAKLVKLKLQVAQRIWFVYAGMSMSLALFFGGLGLSIGHFLPHSTIKLIAEIFCACACVIPGSIVLYLGYRHPHSRSGAIAVFFLFNFLAMPIYWIVWLRPALGPIKWWMLGLILTGLVLFLGTNIFEAW